MHKSCMEQKTQIIVKKKKERKEKRILVLDAFKCHLTLEVSSVIHTMNIDLVVIPRVITHNYTF